jgi:integrase
VLPSGQCSFGYGLTIGDKLNEKDYCFRLLRRGSLQECPRLPLRLGTPTAALIVISQPASASARVAFRATRLTENRAGAPIINSTVSALRFFFTVTLGRADAARHLTFVHEPRKLPVVLSPEEVARLLEAAPGIKYEAALSVAYGAGLRVSEVVSLLSRIAADWRPSVRPSQTNAPCVAGITRLETRIAACRC